MLLVGGLILVALIFDFINGFHDAANSIATVVSTRVLSPGKAVIWAAFFNFVSAFTFGTAVAKTAGAAVAKSGFGALLVAGWTNTLLFIFLSPIIGMAAGMGLLVGIHWLFRSA